MVSSLRTSQDVAGTLSKSLRVSELGAVVGALCPSGGPSRLIRKEEVHCRKSIGREVASPHLVDFRQSQDMRADGYCSVILNTTR